MFVVFAAMACAKLMHDCEALFVHVSTISCNDARTFFSSSIDRCRHTKSCKLSYIHLFLHGTCRFSVCLSMSILCTTQGGIFQTIQTNLVHQSVWQLIHFRSGRSKRTSADKRRNAAEWGEVEYLRLEEKHWYDKVIKSVLLSIPGPPRVHKVPKAVKRLSNTIALEFHRIGNICTHIFLHIII